MKFYKNLKTYYEAKIKIIQIITDENQRLYGELIKLSKEKENDLYVWNKAEGIKKWEFEETNWKIIKEERELEFVLEYFQNEISDKDIFLIEDIVEDFEIPFINKRLEIISDVFINNKNKLLILSQSNYFLPPQLEKKIITLEMDLPNIEDIKVIFERVISDFEIPKERIKEDESIFQSVLGLTTNEIYRAFSRAYIINEELTSDEISLLIESKGNIIKKTGYLEYYHPDEDFENVGGLENLKEWLKKRGDSFSKEAKEYGIVPPKGVLLLGIPGTGKSLAAKSVANLWKFPLLKLDMGKIFGGIVGQSEDNIRKALKLAESLSPSILWLDEIEKGLSGFSSSGSTDGGTTSRVLGTFLTWLQEKKKPVFVIATSNDISKLPPELLRKGRFDEIFFVDLPGKNARKEIFKIHLKKRIGRNKIKNFDLKKLSDLSEGFSGAEIEEAINDAMYDAFFNIEELETLYIENALKKTYPLSKTMAEIITNIRSWAKNRAIFASEEISDFTNDKNIKEIKLKQEYNNPFI
ncbi:AAA family ATPase [Fusobacterium sp. MFO224]|uniref:AAA family ATPase n=1 Tax=Fusobacterium sp. MFO224 TaxID=3378070 RepID=UPI003854BA80